MHAAGVAGLSRQHPFVSETQATRPREACRRPLSGDSGKMNADVHLLTCRQGSALPLRYMQPR